MEDDIEEGSVDVPLVDVDNEAACASVKDELLAFAGEVRLAMRAAERRLELRDANGPLAGDGRVVASAWSVY